MTTDARQRLDRLETFLAVDPLNSHLLFEQADVYLQLNDPGACEAALQRLFEVQPGHHGGRLLRAVLWMGQGKLAEAVEECEQLRDEGLDEPALHYNLAYALMLQGRYAEAEKPAAMAALHLDALPVAGPLYVRALHFLARVDEAVAFAERTLSSQPDHLPLYGMLATLYLDQENLPAAEAMARQVLECSPDDPDAATVLGMLALSQQDLAVATPLLERACVKKPNSGRARMGLGLAAMLRGDFAAAEKDVEQALRHMPGHLGSWQVLAWCRILQNRPAEAQSALREALNLDRNFADTHGGLAITAIMEGRMHDAQQSVKRALGLNPASLPGQYAQSLLLQSAGQATQARAIHEHLMQSALLPDGSSVSQAVVKALALSPEARGGVTSKRPMQG